MLDKSIPYISIIMTKDNPAEYPRYVLPEGYSFCLYRDGLENDWAELQLSVEHMKTLDEAKELFEHEFMKYPDELLKRCVFVKDAAGNIAGTTSIWWGNHFGEVLQRIHWVAVHPDHQGKGIAKALITKVLDINNALGYKSSVYLTSQTWSYKAVNIYLNFGFKPYLGSRPVNWKETCEEFDKNKAEAWKLIMDKINSRANKSKEWG